ncbi:MAG: thermonuclease family protein [Pseudomonadota bacterium]|nr:thermonuclease family protein [Pseudomonadota bacterium]
MTWPTKRRYTLIKGKYWIHYPDIPKQGPEPDGDTVRFEPDNMQSVRNLPWHSGRGPAFNRRKNIAVRYEGIDTLETHFNRAHQHLQFANAARDENLRLLGFRKVVFFTDQPNKVQSVEKNPLPGYVIANGIEANGRLLGLAYSGTSGGASDLTDGEKIFVDEDLQSQSVNAKLVEAGLSYVEPYDTMPLSLIAHLRKLIAGARSMPGKGFWTHEDVNTRKEVQIGDFAKLETLVLWPKLFRRLATYFSEGNSGLAQFDTWVRKDPIHRDDALRLPDGEKGNMHNTYIISGDSLKLQFNPEELLIEPDPKRIF